MIYFLRKYGWILLVRLDVFGASARFAGRLLPSSAPASPSNPASSILPAAFALARDAIQGIAQALVLSLR
jgi:hypothetical protein